MTLSSRRRRRTISTAWIRPLRRRDALSSTSSDTVATYTGPTRRSGSFFAVRATPPADGRLGGGGLPVRTGRRQDPWLREDLAHLKWKKPTAVGSLHAGPTGHPPPQLRIDSSLPESGLIDRDSPAPRDEEVIEAALAHRVHNQVEAAYARSDLFERRRRLMDDWAAAVCQSVPVRRSLA